jgi:hypothetical protein
VPNFSLALLAYPVAVIPAEVPESTHLRSRSPVEIPVSGYRPNRNDKVWDAGILDY